jgi:hypothetical protein
MTHMDLFLVEPTLTFDETPKTAGAKLDEDSSNWPSQILTELYRVLPSIAEYTPQVQFFKIDQERGAALGVIRVVKSTDSAMAAIRANDVNIPRLMIPLIINDYELSPLDTIIKPSGVMTPLTETRLREALFRPETADLLTTDFGDTSLFGMLYPPGRADNTFGSGFSSGASGAQTMYGPGMKMSSEAFPLLSEIGASIHGADIEMLVRSIETQPGLLEKVSENMHFLAALQVLQAGNEAREKAASEQLSVRETLEDAFDPDVVQLSWSPSYGTYVMKTASRRYFSHTAPRLVSRGDLLKIAGEEVVKKVDLDGSVTIAAPTGVDEAAPEKTWKPITRSGIYRVQSVDGRELTGWVLSSLLSPDGIAIPMCVFTNGSEACVQTNVVGTRVATGADLPEGKPQGTGVFYTSVDGQIVATVPLMVLGSEAGMDGGNSFIVRTLDGADTRVHVVDGIQSMVVLHGEYFCPRVMHFLPVQNEKTVVLVDTMEGMHAAKQASFDESGSIRINHANGHFRFRFENMPKLASKFPASLDHEAAAFVLCLAGYSSPEAYTKLSAAQQGPINVKGCDVGLQSDMIDSVKEASLEASHRVTELRRYFTKEAAVMPNASTIDSLLSLEFINSENIRLFVSRIPTLEKALSQLCELVLASRLGISEIPETAGARAARGLDEVIQGLRALMFRDAEEPA